MINLRGIANSAIQSINPNQSIDVSVPDGYIINPDTLLQEPKYILETVQGNVQSLSSDDLKQMDGLNIEGTLRAVYVYGNYGGVLRPDGQPNSILRFVTNESGVTKARDWNVYKVLEAWPMWCKVAVVLQTEEIP